MSLLEQASLVVTPNAYKESKLYSVIPNTTLGDMDVVRATTATRVNEQGLIEVVPRNLFTYSEQFDNAIWEKQLGSSITSNTTIAPNGTLTADTLSILSDQYFYQQLNLNSSVVYTISIYIKVASGTKQFKFNTFGAGNNFTSSTLTATTEWQRFNYTFTTIGTGTTAIYPILVDGLTGGDFYIWGAQLEQGSTATTYFPTTTRLNIPRIDYTNGSCPSLLVEPQRTNLLSYSEEFDNAIWGAPSNVIANSVTSPSGIQNADTLTGGLYRLQVFSATTYVFSFYAKKNTQSTFSMRVDAPTNQTFSFNLDTGTADGGCSMINVGNGWYRCFMPFTSSLSGTGVFYPNVGGNNFYIWGAQLEQGSYATSYIPTVASSVTRNADVISKTGISSLIGQTEGTLFADVNITIKKEDTSPVVSILTLNNNVANVDNAVVIGIDRPATGTVNQIYAYVQVSNSTVVILNTSAITNGRYKIAFAYKANDFVLYVNGVQIGTDTNGAVPTCSQVLIGERFNSDPFKLADSINSAQLYKTRLTNTELVQLTTI